MLLGMEHALLTAAFRDLLISFPYVIADVPSVLLRPHDRAGCEGKAPAPKQLDGSMDFDLLIRLEATGHSSLAVLRQGYSYRALPNVDVLGS